MERYEDCLRRARAECERSAPYRIERMKNRVLTRCASCGRRAIICTHALTTYAGRAEVEALLCAECAALAEEEAPR